MLGFVGIDQDFGDRRHGSEEEYTLLGNNVKTPRSGVELPEFQSWKQPD